MPSAHFQRMLLELRVRNLGGDAALLLLQEGPRVGTIENGSAHSYYKHLSDIVSASYTRDDKEHPIGRQERVLLKKGDVLTLSYQGKSCCLRVQDAKS